MEDIVAVEVRLSDASEARLTVTGVPDRPGAAARLFRALAHRSINVDMIVQNSSVHDTTDISFTVPTDELRLTVETLRAFDDDD
jgi:aspartate kinase